MTNVLLVIALVAPLAAAAIAFAIELPMVTSVRAGALAGASIAGGLLAAGAHPVAGSLQPDPLALAAMAGAFLVLAVVADPRDAPLGALAGTAATVGVIAASHGSPSASGAVLGALAALAFASAGGSGWNATIAAGGLTVVALGAATDGRTALAVVAVGCAIAVVSVSPHSTAVAAVALPAILVAGLRALPAVDSVAIEPRRTAAVVLAGVALAAAAVPWVVRRVPDLGVAPSLAALSLAAAASGVPGSLPTAAPLGAAAVLALALPAPIRMVPALPGIALFGDALLAARGRTALAVGVLCGIAVVLAAAPRRRATRPAVGQFAATAVGGWLVLRPSSFAWAGPLDAHSFEIAIADAAAGGLVVLVAYALVHRDDVPARQALPAGTRRPPPLRLAHRAAPFAVCVAMLAVAALLLRSGAL